MVSNILIGPLPAWAAWHGLNFALSRIFWTKRGCSSVLLRKGKIGYRVLSKKNKHYSFFDLLPAINPQPLEPSKKPRSYQPPVLLTA